MGCGLFYPPQGQDFTPSTGGFKNSANDTEQGSCQKSHSTLVQQYVFKKYRRIFL